MTLEDLPAHLNSLNQSDWDKLFSLIQPIESHKGYDGDWEDTDNIPAGFKLTTESEADIIGVFQNRMYELDLVINFNWGHWDEGRKLVRSGKYDNVDTITLLKLLTAIIRNNRFCDGALAAAFGDGTIERILKQLKKNIELG